MKKDLTYRYMQIANGTTASIDVENRTVQLAFSSENPYERSFGLEVLSHNPEDVDMSFLASGSAPLLLEHDPERQIGVIESAVLENGVGRAIVRFSRNEDADEVFQDVVDQIRQNVSVGYVITGKSVDNSTNPPTVICQWCPMEISVVAIPADQTVGVGRSAEEITEEIQADITATTNITTEENTMENTNVETAVETRAADIEIIKQEVQTAERSRVSAINELATRHGVSEIGNEFISNGKTVDEFRAAVLDKLAQRPAVSNHAPIGMSTQETKEYSLGRAFKAMVSGDWSDAGLELEASKATAKQLGRAHTMASIFVPNEYLTRAGQSVGGTNVGSQLVGTNLLSQSFMDVLYNNSIARALGVSYMSGLVGNVDMPKFTSKVGAYEVAEGADITLSTVSTGKVTMSPRQFAALVEFTRSMAIQSTPNVEAMLRASLVKALSEKIDQIVFAAIAADTDVDYVSLTGDSGAPSWSTVMSVINTLELGNALNDGCKWALNPKAANVFRSTLKDTNTAGIYLLDQAKQIAGYGVETSNNVPTAGAVATALFGDFSTVTVGSWASLELALDTSQKFLSGGYLLRAMTDMDVAVTRPESISGFVDVAV